MENQYPILEFDPDPDAILNPRNHLSLVKIPPRAVLCFFQDVLSRLIQEGRLQKISSLVSEIGENPIYHLEWEGKELAVVHPGVGAALAAGFLEELIALNVQTFIACGGCGVLDHAIAVGHPVILTSAVRDEGTSYHYLPPGREVASSPQAVDALEQSCRAQGLEYLLGKTWTTDGLYRETAGRRALRLLDGCMVVEMEAAAFFAVSQFRKVVFGQVVYGGDLVVPQGWDKRGWVERKSSRELLFWLAVEACCRL